MTKKVTIDLRASGLFGPSCKCLEMFEDLRYRGYEINLIAQEWSSSTTSGLVYDEKTRKYLPGDSQYLFDPTTHPRDFYENLVVPTFSNLNYITHRKKSSRILRFLSMFARAFSPRYFSHVDFVSTYMEPLERVRYHQQKVDHFFTKPSIKQFIYYIYFVLQLKLFSHLKIYSDSKGFRYQLTPSLLDDRVLDYIKKAKQNSARYVLISANWDDAKLYEKQDDRLRGVLYEEVEFMSMVRFVQDLDQYAKQGKIKFVLASKKAVDWPKIIENEFLDLREFEKLGFTLSQSIYILQEITSMTINWPSTFSIWMTNCTGILHLTWRDNKDTARWARNNLHKEPVERALKLIGVV